MSNATPRQLQVLDTIIRSVDRHHYQPSMAEMGVTLGCNRNCVYEHLKALERKGYIQMTGQARAVVLLDKCFVNRGTS